MENHVKAWRAHRVLSWLYGLAVLVVGFQAYRNEGAGRLDLLLAWGGLFLVFAVCHAWIGQAALARRPWARFASILLGFLLLVVFPVGTIIGVYLLSASWNPWTQPVTHGSPAASGWPQDAVRDRPRVGGR